MFDVQVVVVAPRQPPRRPRRVPGWRLGGEERVLGAGGVIGGVRHVRGHEAADVSKGVGRIVVWRLPRRVGANGVVAICLVFVRVSIYGPSAMFKSVSCATTAVRTTWSL